MGCPPVDLKDYFFGELPQAELARVKEHVAGCQECRLEIDRLRMTQAAMSSLGEEELPRRIAFVSDKVFEPRWWQRLWRSGPQLGFISASILAASILVHAWTRPVPVVGPAGVSQAEVAHRIEAAVKEAEARQSAKTVQLLAAAEKRFEFDRAALMLAVDKEFDVLQKEVRRAIYIARNDGGGAR
jgi:anti-sigma factor RsiW